MRFDHRKLGDTTRKWRQPSVHGRFDACLHTGYTDDATRDDWHRVRIHDDRRLIVILNEDEGRDQTRALATDENRIRGCECSQSRGGLHRSATERVSLWTRIQTPREQQAGIQTTLE